MLERLDTNEWKEAFKVAGLSTDRVEKVISSAEGILNGEAWLSYGLLKEGEYYLLIADQVSSISRSGTGWLANYWLYDNADTLISEALTQFDRDRLGLAERYIPNKPTVEISED